MGRGRHTVIRMKTLSSKASSSARDLRISGSVEMLMRIVRAFLAMGCVALAVGGASLGKRELLHTV